MWDSYKKDTMLALKKAQGQVGHILSMVEDDKYCMDIAQQVNAAMGLLKQVNHHILESHLLSCAAHKLQSKNMTEKKKFVSELAKVFNITGRK